MIEFMEILELIAYGFVGLGGSLTTLFLLPKKPTEAWLWIRRAWLGFVAGAIYHYVMINAGLPNGVAVFLVGATAQMFLEALILRKAKVEIPHTKLICKGEGQDQEESNG
ncbi:MAG: hypothetical protein JSW41_03865 [Candidatus Aenigmatarchaeota archaeon]|nr:MAG: hypothetical protein JSW41_03865 [Candidatus Aenigmarchaeota archaeon]